MVFDYDFKFSTDCYKASLNENINENPFLLYNAIESLISPIFYGHILFQKPNYLIKKNFDFQDLEF